MTACQNRDQQIFYRISQFWHSMFWKGTLCCLLQRNLVDHIGTTDLSSNAPKRGPCHNFYLNVSWKHSRAGNCGKLGVELEYIQLLLRTNREYPITSVDTQERLEEQYKSAWFVEGDPFYDVFATDFRLFSSFKSKLLVSYFLFYWCMEKFGSERIVSQLCC